MKPDLRGFRYALEPLLRQRQWQLDAVQSELGQVRRELEKATRALEMLRGRYDEQSRLASRALSVRLEPRSHAQRLGWLRSLRDMVASAEKTVRKLHALRGEVSARCLAHQQRLEVIERHREDCQEEFLRDAESRNLSETDRDWLARRAASGGARRSMLEETT